MDDQHDEVDRAVPVATKGKVIDVVNRQKNDDCDLDPRVQAELDRLNLYTDDINRLELELEEANSVFRTLLSDSTQQLKATSSKVGSSCIEQARPYYIARERADRAQKECQSAATHYQRASGVHAAAKETITLAEDRFLTNSSQWTFDNAWQEMLNHATIKVMKAEREKAESGAEHARRAAAFTRIEQEAHRLEKQLRKQVQKSKVYFEEKAAFNRALEDQKARVQHLQERVKVSKADYARSLRSLECISESIHAKRKLQRHREPGVGSEESKDPTYDSDVVIGGSDDILSARSEVSGRSDSHHDLSCIF